MTEPGESDMKEVIDQLIKIINDNVIITEGSEDLLRTITEKHKYFKDNKNGQIFFHVMKKHINQLLGADEELMTIFKDILNLPSYSEDYELKNSIQKLNYQLFNLQIKIIFDKLYKLEELTNQLKKNNTDVKNKLQDLIDKFNNKIIAMEQLFSLQIASRDSLLEGLEKEMQKNVVAEISPKLPTIVSSPQPKPHPLGLESGLHPEVKIKAEHLYQTEPEQIELQPREIESTLDVQGDVPKIDINKIKDNLLGKENITNPKIFLVEFANTFGKHMEQSLSGGFKQIFMIGGSKMDSIKIINNFMKQYNIFNSSIMLKFMTILSSPDTFNNCVENMGVKEPKNLVKYFFKLLNSDELDKLIKLNLLNNDDVIRDTNIYKLYFPESTDNYIFIYKLLKNINSYIREKDIEHIFGNYIDALLQFTIFYDLSVRIKQIYELYKALKKNEIAIDHCYDKFINGTKKLFTYVKIRQDSSNINPRFVVKKYREKYLFMKYYNLPNQLKSNLVKISTQDPNSEEYYYFGPYDGIYTKDKTNKQIATENKIIEQRLLDGKNVCVIGYGQSGAGKTSALIYLETNDKKNQGILMEICNLPSINNKYKTIKLQMIELKIFHKGDIDHPSKVEKHLYDINRLINDKENIVFTKDENNVWINNNNTIGEYINNKFKERKIEPTPNNPVSSRSHVLIDLMFTDNENKQVHLIICDLAGVENVFNCNNTNEIIKFSNNYTLGTKNILFNKSEAICDLKNKLNNNYHNDFNKNNKVLCDEYNTGVDSIKTYVDTLSKFPQTGGYCDCKDEVQFKCENNITHLSEYKTEKDFGNNLDNIIYNYITFYTILLYVIFTLGRYINKLKADGISKLNKNLTIPKDIINHLNSIIKKNISKYITDKNFSQINSLFEKTIKKIPKFELNKASNSEELSKNIIRYILKISNIEIGGLTIERIITNLKNITNNKNDIKQKLNEYMCDHARVLKIKYNCKLRVIEGHMINRSLDDLRTDIRNITLSSIKKNIKNLLVYAKPEIPYCSNIYIDIDKYEPFYKNIKGVEETGQIINIIKNQFNVTITDMTFVIFTVINLSENVNNPPIPPYININDIKYYFNLYNTDKTSDNHKKLTEELTKLNTKLNTYPYYKNTSISDLFINRINNSNNILNIIDKINATTLIGSLEASDRMINFSDHDFICSRQKQLEVILEKYAKIADTLPQFYKTNKNDKYITVDKINKLIDDQEKNNQLELIEK